MARVINFSAGPSILPKPVLLKIQEELLDYQGSGQSVMEMSHRSDFFMGIIEQTEADLRSLLNIPQNYKVLFLQGGASLQFSMVPMNLMHKYHKADFVITGEWARKAAQEAKRYGEVHIVASSEDKNFNVIPKFKAKDFSSDADYIHYVSNNTIFGTRITNFPDVSGKVLVCDMSSDILSRPIDVSKYGIIFAGAQKNMGIAGLTIVIIREDLIGLVPNLPPMLDYKVQAEHGSMYNTPSCFSIYVAGLCFKWIKDLGGLTEMEHLNNAKAKLLYDYLDESYFFAPTIQNKNDRSIMNICFLTPTKESDKSFINYAEIKGLINLKGHRSVGGMRASLYNGMPIEGVEELIRVMREYEDLQR
ncbi:MAG: phosphoserine aminotransferase [Erysipelotrichaceae bacterium]|nr:MAG: phosphoserine [Erysipelotrichaceae bacterium]TXT18084.1 MAG: phosphoserine aminotransferase [Erysipelotrichaceae bacterium]